MHGVDGLYLRKSHAIIIANNDNKIVFHQPAFILKVTTMPTPQTNNNSLATQPQTNANMDSYPPSSNQGQPLSFLNATYERMPPSIKQKHQEEKKIGVNQIGNTISIQPRFAFRVLSKEIPPLSFGK